MEDAFIKCCRQHDLCYDTCNMDKDDCDLQFKRCLYAHCKKKKEQNSAHLQKYFNNQKCKLKAKLFYVTVIGVGCQAYRDAQHAACECVRILEKGRTATNINRKHFHETDEL